MRCDLISTKVGSFEVHSFVPKRGPPTNGQKWAETQNNFVLASNAIGHICVKHLPHLEQHSDVQFVRAKRTIIAHLCSTSVVFGQFCAVSHVQRLWSLIRSSIAASAGRGLCAPCQ